MKAAELISQIKAAYVALMKAETDGFGQTLFLAIDLGVLLSQAKADPDVGTHGKWEKWFNDQNFGFSLRKAQRCMRYAEKKDELVAAAKTSALTHLVANHRLGICDADALLRKPKASGSGTTHKSSKASVAPPDPPAQTDPAKVIANLDVDEVLDNVKAGWEPSKQQWLLTQQLKATPPDKLATILSHEWTDADVGALVTQLSEHLKRKTAWPGSASPAPPIRPRTQQTEGRPAA
jgi:hypothetical protein